MQRILEELRFVQKQREIGGHIMLSSAVFLMLMKNSWDGFRKHMNPATENSTTSTRTETRTSLDQELLLKVLSNPEMATLLTILSRQLPVDKDDENRNSPLGAKNNDSHSEKQAIVIFYPLKYRKCGNFN